MSSAKRNCSKPKDVSAKLLLKDNSEDWIENSRKSKEIEKMLENHYRKLEDRTVPEKYAIYCLTTSNSEVEKYLIPKVVSIGPYHRGKSHLAKTDSHKVRFLKDFLLRNPGTSYNQYLDRFKKAEPYLRNYYSLELNLTCDEFADMMLNDGCFIMELLIKNYNQTSDDILEDCSLLQYIKSDLLMFGNQIPFCILKNLHGPENMGSMPGIYRLLVDFFWDTSYGFPALRIFSESRNLLQFYYDQFIPLHVEENWEGTDVDDNSSLGIRTVSPRRYLEEHPKQILSVQLLARAGIIFRRKSSNNFLDITFRDGVLEVPPISMDEPNLVFFVNLIIVEIHGCTYRKIMQAYCDLMGSLLQTAEDVELWQELGIIEGGSMSVEEICNLFYKFHDPYYVINEHNYYLGLFTDLLEFCMDAEDSDLGWPAVRNSWLSVRNACTVGLLRMKSLFKSSTYKSE